MTKKRKFHFTYADSTQEEKYIIKKDFNEMLKEIFFKVGHTLIEFIIPNLIILLLIALLLNNISTKLNTIAIILLIIAIPLYLLKLYRTWKK